MHRLDGVQRDTELACILHVHHQTIRRYVPDRAEFIVAIGNEGLVPDLDCLSHDALSSSRYWAVYPPSIGNIWPVTNEASLEQSQTTVLAISSGRPMRPMGCAASSICLTSGAVAKSRNIRVSIAPGATALTRTFCLAYSSATDLVNPATACLLAA